MSILKQTLHPKNDNNTDIYPKTSTDQIEDLNPSFEIDIDATELEENGIMDLTLDTELGGINRTSRASMPVAREVHFSITDLDQLNYGVLQFNVGIKIGNQWVDSEEVTIDIYKTLIPQSNLQTAETDNIYYIVDSYTTERVVKKLPIMYNNKVYYIASVSSASYVYTCPLSGTTPSYISINPTTFETDL